MPATYSIYLTDMFGTKMQHLSNVASMSYAKRENDRSAFIINFDKGAVDLNMLARDRRIVVWRKSDTTGGRGSKYAIDFSGLMRVVGQARSSTRELVSVAGFGPQDVLNRRRVAALSGSAEAKKTAFADDMMKELVLEQLGSSAASDRDISSLLNIDASTGSAPSITKGMSYRNLLTVIRDIAQDSREAGTPLFFDVVPDGEKQFRFRTFVNQRGSDRVVASPTILRADAGDIDNPSLQDDYRLEVTRVYALGPGTEGGREVQQAEDTDRSAESVFNLIESAINASSIRTTTGLLQAAEAGVARGRPVVRFSAQIRDSASVRYNSDWSFGDKLKVVYGGRLLTVHVMGVTIELREDGRETIIAQLGQVD